MKKKKIVIGIIISVIIIIIIIGAIILFALKGLGQEVAIKNEIQEIDEMASDINTMNIEEFNRKTSELITQGDYAIVEKAVKDYLKESINYILEIKDLLENSRMNDILTIDNIKEDEPDFVETTTYINETKTKLEEAKVKLVDMLTEEKMMSYINGKIDDEYYIDLYKEIVTANDEIGLKEDDEKELEDTIDTLIKILDIENEAITLLKDNKNSWVIENDKIAFDTDELVDEYNSLLSELQTLEI